MEINDRIGFCGDKFVVTEIRRDGDGVVESVTLKPYKRYKVEKEQDWYLVVDKETPKNDWGNEQIATFYNHKSIDAKAEATKLCKQLNEGEP